MLLHDIASRCAERLGDKPALIGGNTRLTYAELVRRARSLAAVLRERGVRRGDRVLLYLDNRPEFAVAMLAVLECGGVFVPVNPMTRAEKLAALMADAEPRAVIAEGSLSAELARAAQGAPGLAFVVLSGAPAASAVPDLPLVDFSEALCASAAAASCGTIDQDLASLIYTSGSTGKPKGVMLTHLNMLSATRSIVQYLGLRQGDVIYCALPLSFDYGLYQLFQAFTVGATVVLDRTFAFPAQSMEMVAREKVTVFPGVPTMFTMLSRLGTLGSRDLSSLRLVTNTAAALSERLIAEIGRMFPDATLFSMYGLTECKRVSYLPPSELARRPTSVGRGMPNQELWLAGPDGERLPPGSTGELVVRGSHVMRGYWRDPEATAKRLRPGPNPGELVLHTGDIFRMDEEGFLYFVARTDDMIKSRGEKVSPREVENILARLEGVLECAVTGVPDELLGQAVKAYVVCRPGHQYTEREIIRHCANSLEPFMVPQQVEFLAELPRSPNGKIRIPAVTP